MSDVFVLALLAVEYSGAEVTLSWPSVIEYVHGGFVESVRMCFDGDSEVGFTVLKYSLPGSFCGFPGLFF